MAFPTGWGRIQKITIQNSKVVGTGSHLNVPVLITLSHLNSEIVDAGSNSALNGGGDVRFSTDLAGTTQLACEIVSFVTNASAPSRECEIWVKIPSVSTSANTDIYIWYNKAGESQPAVSAAFGRDAVWAGYEFLTHDMINDSSGNRTITQDNAGVTIDSPWGKVAHDFNGSVDYHTAPITGINLNSNLTITLWAKADTGNTFPRLLDLTTADGYVQINADTDFGAGAYAFASDTLIGGDATSIQRSSGAANIWERIACTHIGIGSGKTIRIGTTNYTATSLSWGAGSSTNQITIAQRSDNASFYNGSISLLGIRAAIISNDVLDTEYNNQNDPATFATAGTPAPADPNAIPIQSANHAHAADGLTLTGNIPIADMGIQHISDGIGNTGGTNTSFTAVASLNNAIELPNNNRMGHAGATTLTASNREGDDMAGARVLTAAGTLTYYREIGSIAENMAFRTSLWEYVGAASGANEFIVRGRYAVSLNGVTNSATQALTGITTATDCIPIVTGIMNNAIADDFDSQTAIAYLENNTTLRVQKGSNANNVTVYITVVEFTGTNWTVLHGDSGASAADTGSIIIRDGSDGTGTATNVSAWTEAIIFGQFRADTGASGTDDAISDLWPVYDVGIGSQTVDWAFHTDHVSAGATNRHFVHVLNHSNLAVTRYQDTSSTSGESTVDIASAGLSDLAQSLIVGSSTSSGTGIALPRGYRNYYLNSLTQAAHWCTRSGNIMAHEIQIVDLTGLTTTAGGSNLIIAESTHSHGADNVTLTQVHGLTVNEAAQALNSDQIVLDVSLIMIREANHLPTSDNLLLSQVNNINISSATHALGSDNFSFSQIHTVSVNDAGHGHNSDVLGIIVETEQSLTLAPCVHALLSDGLTLGYATTLVISEAAEKHFADHMIFTQNHALVVAASDHQQIADQFITDIYVGIDECTHNLLNDVVIFSQTHNLSPAPIYHEMLADAPYVRVPAGVWADTEEDIPNWSNEAQQNPGWSIDAANSSTWNEVNQENPGWQTQSENQKNWSEE